jgi:glycerol-3-phosphate acyltransferase PlsY
MTAGPILLVTGLGFLLGSIPFPYLFTRRRGIDLRTVGSGNVGATNALRVSSPATAITVLALDATKGSLAVWIADALTRQNTLAVLAGLAAILGHVYPPWLGFRGGKGMATTAGVFAMLAPAATVVSAAVFVLLVAISRVVSVGSLGAMVALPPLTAWFAGSPAVVVGACAAAAFVVFRHRTNMRRLWLGVERRLGQGL